MSGIPLIFRNGKSYRFTKIECKNNFLLQNPAHMSMERFYKHIQNGKHLLAMPYFTYFIEVLETKVYVLYKQ